MKVVKSLLFIALAIGISISGYAIWEIFQTKTKTKESVEEAKNIISKSTNDNLNVEHFSPAQGDVAGLLRIPSIEAELPIIEGTDPDDLKKGVGHYKDSYYPGQNGQIILSGHRDTVFRNLGELELGDELVIEVPYGKFAYKINQTKIVDADHTGIITLQKDYEELIVTTCYPFRYIGDAPQRYIIYAKRK